jgi:hypothetical protein
VSDEEMVMSARDAFRFINDLDAAVMSDHVAREKQVYEPDFAMLIRWIWC